MSAELALGLTPSLVIALTTKSKDDSHACFVRATALAHVFAAQRASASGKHFSHGKLKFGSCERMDE